MPSNGKPIYSGSDDELLAIAHKSTPAEIDLGLGRPDKEVRMGALVNAKLMVAHLVASALQAFSNGDEDMEVRVQAEDVLDDMLEIVEQSQEAMSRRGISHK